MAAAKRKRHERAADLQLIKDWFLEGLSIREMARRLGEVREYSLVPSVVGRDLQAVIGEWRATFAHDVGTMRNAELARLAKTEREAWAQWEASKKQAERVETDSDGYTKTIIEGRCGNPRYLEVVTACIEKRCRLLGLNAPAKCEHTGKDGAPIAWESRNGKELADVLAQYNEVITEISRAQAEKQG